MKRRIGRSFRAIIPPLMFCLLLMTCLTGCGENAGDSSGSTATGAAGSPTLTDLMYYAVSIVPSTTSVNAGEVSIITATVTSTSGSTTTNASGVTVTFTLPVNNTGATLTTPSGTGATVTATTDATGNAVAIYQPGMTNFDRTVSDGVQASVTGASTAVSITRTGSYVSDIRIDLVQSTIWEGNISPWYGQSVMTATVINNDDKTPISGVTVTFWIEARGTAGGSVQPLTSTTDNNGNAVTVYRANNLTTFGTSDAVMCSVTRDGYTYTDGVVISVAGHP